MNPHSKQVFCKTVLNFDCFSHLGGTAQCDAHQGCTTSLGTAGEFVSGNKDSILSFAP